jgi:hypothetical protein
VQNQEQTFDKRELLSQGSVEENGEGRDRDDEERTMPWPLTLQRVLLVVQSNQSLDDCPAQEGDGADCSLPPSETEPADDIRQESLAARRRPFGDPVVLTSGSWSPVGG